MTDPNSTVVPYDPDWPALFDRLRQRLEPVLTGIDATIQHIGSTSVPGLAAKPIIDMDVVVTSTGMVSEAIDRLGKLGYIHTGNQGIAGREALKIPETTEDHYLYVVVAGNQAHRDHVDLRDYLRAHPAEARRYAVTKQQAAHLLVQDRPSYFAAKAPMIEELLYRARNADHA